jgi:branched-chain amino acid transport system ATP-binding protein
MSASEYILETRGLTKEFKGFVAVNGVDLKIQRGTIHALIGPNDAGKTTCSILLTHFNPEGAKVLH